MAKELLAETTPERLAAHSDERLEELYRELATIPNIQSNLLQILRNRAELVGEEIARRRQRRERDHHEAEVERRHREQIAVAEHHSTRAERLALAALIVSILSVIATGLQAYYGRPQSSSLQLIPTSILAPSVSPALSPTAQTTEETPSSDTTP